MRFRDARCGVRGAAAEFRVDVIAPVDAPGLTVVTSRDIVSVSGEAEVVHFRSAAEQAAAPHDVGFRVCALQPGQRLLARLVARWGTRAAMGAARWTCVRPALRDLDPEGDEGGHPRRTPGGVMTVQTTGAVSAMGACTAALEAVLGRLEAVRDA
jgi:hypothetical protein